METVHEWLATIPDPAHRERAAAVLQKIQTAYPQLVLTIKWNQPMFLDHGTFIVGFSASQKHLALAPEAAAITHFHDQIRAAGYTATQQLLRLPWDQPVPTALLHAIITFNIQDKAAMTTFWRHKTD